MNIVISGHGNLSPILLVRANVASASRCVMPLKIKIKEQIMTHSYLSSMFGPIMIGVGLAVSGGLIVGLANADMYPNTHKRAEFKAKKLDLNNDGLISLDELTSRENRRFQKLDRDKVGQIGEDEFNARLVAMFNRMDNNSDGILDDVEILKPRYHRHGKGYNS